LGRLFICSLHLRAAAKDKHHNVMDASEPRVRDEDLGSFLGFARRCLSTAAALHGTSESGPRAIRDLIKKHPALGARSITFDTTATPRNRRRLQFLQTFSKSWAVSKGLTGTERDLGIGRKPRKSNSYLRKTSDSA